jgi:hypothetical protein
MYQNDHNPPHFDVEYLALMAIETGEVLAAKLPNKATKLVREWAKEHQEELLINWDLAVALKALNRISGADND